MKKQLVAIPINGIEHTVQPGLIDGDTTAISSGAGIVPISRQQGSNWWQQSMGVMRVRNGFAVQGLIALPIPQIGASDASAQRVLSRNQSTTEPVRLN